MSVNRFLRTPAVLLTQKMVEGPPVYDDMGDIISGGGSEPVMVETSTRCRLVHERTIENRDGGLVSVEQVRVYLPATLPPPAATDRIRIREREYAFEGPAHAVESPRDGRAAYVEATLRLAS